jgi:trehalose-6-phosphate synthase
MVVREAGLIFRGFYLVKKSYHKTTKGKIDQDLRSGLLTAILNFAETAFTKDTVEYFEMNKLLITFKEDRLVAKDSLEPETLISYVVLDKEKKVEKYIHKVIQPLLHKVIQEFKANHMGKNFSEVSQFKVFKQNLDRIFGTDTQTVDQKLKGIFSDRTDIKEIEEED